MNRIIRLTALTLVLVAAIPAFAQRAGSNNSFASDFQTIPVMGNTPGLNGATFQSYVALLNPTSSSFAVEVNFYDNTGTRRTASITLAPGELKTYENFLATVFQFTGGGAATFRSPSPANRFVISTEVKTSGTRFNTMIPVLEFPSTGSRSYSSGITIDANNRTNVGCFNQSSSTNVVRATLMNGAGTEVVSTVDWTLPPNAWVQVGVSGPVTDGYVQFDPAEPAVCYAVVVDNSTNDGRFVSAAEFEP
jgi:hypothetical protein